MTPEELQRRILHRDASVIVLNKPAGVPVHAGPKGGRTLTDDLDALRFGLKWRPEMAHRLDRDTSGCLVLGRHPTALRTLNGLFKQGRIGKTYWAVVDGAPPQTEGLIDMALARKSPERGWWMKPDPSGLPSQTRYRLLGSSDGIAWLELTPLTGRTHQLRVHCASSGFPIVGDSVYGTADRFNGQPLHLHARAISLPLEQGKPAIDVKAPPPPHMEERLTLCGWTPGTVV